MTSSTAEATPSHKAQLEMLMLKLQTGAISEADRTKVGEQLGMATLLSPQAQENEALQNSLARTLVNFVKLNGAMLVFDFLDEAIKRLDSLNQKVDANAVVAALGLFSNTIETHHRDAEDKFRAAVEAIINRKPEGRTTPPENEEEAE